MDNPTNYWSMPRWRTYALVSQVGAHILTTCVCVVQEENKCVCCCKLKQELEISLQGISSARKIIQILQEDVNAKPDLDTVSTDVANTNHDFNFETVNTKLRRKNFQLNQPTRCSNFSSLLLVI